MDGQLVMAPLPVHISDINRLIEYIKNQHEHHQRISFEEEYRKLLLGLRYNPGRKVFSIILYSAPSELVIVGGYLPLAGARGYSHSALSEPSHSPLNSPLRKPRSGLI
jgi:hypothetical protein